MHVFGGSLLLSVTGARIMPVMGEHIGLYGSGVTGCGLGGGNPVLAVGPRGLAAGRLAILDLSVSGGRSRARLLVGRFEVAAPGRHWLREGNIREGGGNCDVEPDSDTEPDKDTEPDNEAI